MRFVRRAPNGRCHTCGETGPIIVRGNLQARGVRARFRPACGVFFPGRFVDLPPDADMAITCKACGSYDVEGTDPGCATVVNRALAAGLDPVVNVQVVAASRYSN